MRRLLVSAFLASFMLFLAPVSAQAETFNCYCGTVGGECPSFSTVDAASVGAATTPCVNLCEERGLEMCALKAASVDCPVGTVCLVNPLKTASVPELVSNVIKAAVGVVGAFALLIFVYGGFLWLTSGGEAAKIQAGKDAMKWTAIGLAVVFSSYALVSFVLSTLTNVG